MKSGRTHGVYALVLKKTAKELDPRFFDPLERKKSNESDVAEWAQWIRNKVTTVVPPGMEEKIPKNQIISVPMRYVRTN